MKEKMDHKSKHQRKETEREKVLLLEKTIQELKDELLLVNTESEAKDELLAKQAKVAKEAVTGWQKAESEVLTMKQQIKKLMHQNFEFEQNLAKLREEKDEISGQTKNLEEKLVEANDKVSILIMENKNLYAILDTKETIIKEMNESSDKASFTEMKVRVDATEKENANLKYELHMAQKELEIRNKERDYNIKTAEAAYKQQMESLKKASKLEAECNKLKMMLRKRLPGPGAIAKMRNELGLSSNTGTETRKKSSSPLVEKLHVIEEENRVLKETLARKNEDSMSCVTESWATTFISELEHLKEDKFEGSNSEFGLEDDQFQNYPSWLKDIVRVIIKKHYVIQISVKKIIEEVLDALKKTGFYKDEEKDVERCTDDRKSAEVDDETSAVPENGDCRATKETSKTALSNVEVTDNHSEEVESQGSNNPDSEANKATDGVNDGFDKECDKGVEREVGENDDKSIPKEENNDEKELKGPDELEVDASKEAKRSSEHESEPKPESEDTEGDDDTTGDGTNGDDTKGEKGQLETESDAVEGSKKLAECEEEMQSISKQLQALSEQKNNTSSGQKDDSVANPKSSRKSCSLSKILAEDSVQKEYSNEEEKSETLMAEHENGADVVVKLPETDVAMKSVTTKRQKESKGLLSRIFGGRKRREIEPEKEI